MFKSLTVIAAAGLLMSCAGEPAAEAQAQADPAPLSPISLDSEGVQMLRVFSREDGTSSGEVIELPRTGGIPGEFVQSRLYATDVEIGDSAPGTFIDWHGVSTPRLLVVLAGKLEVGLGDGSKHVLSKGDIVLAADTTGRGHTSRTFGDETLRVMTVRLPAEDSLAPKMDPCPAGMDRADCVAANLPQTAAPE